MNAYTCPTVHCLFVNFHIILHFSKVTRTIPLFPRVSVASQIITGDSLLAYLHLVMFNLYLGQDREVKPKILYFFNKFKLRCLLLKMLFEVFQKSLRVEMSL